MFTLSDKKIESNEGVCTEFVDGFKVNEKGAKVFTLSDKKNRKERM